MMSLGATIRKAREKLGLTQKDLAAKTGVKSTQTVIDIERGKRELKAAEVVRFARALFLDIADLVGAPAAEPSEAVVVWRQGGGVSKEAEARFLQKTRQYHLVEQLSGCTKGRDLPREPFDPASATYRSVREMAQRVWQGMGLGTRPGPSLLKVLTEAYFVKVWHFPLADAASSACAAGPFGEAILIDSQEAPWRRNFNGAHELFHLLTWETTKAVWQSGDGPQITQLEKYADAFASALLLPTEEVTYSFDRELKGGEITFRSLVEIAREYEVSSAALLWRLVSLGRLQEASVRDLTQNENFRAIDKSTMPSLWHDPLPLPERFVRLAFFAHSAGKLSRARLAELLNTDLVKLPTVLEEYGLHEDEDYEQTLRAG